jgi:signal transduction histidine kinase
LEELTTSFLLYGRPQKKDMKKIYLRDEIQRICKLLQQRRRFANIAVNMKIEKEISVYMDPDLFTQAILNVILNAFQAVDKNTGQITLSAWKTGQYINLKIQDNGPGISQEDIESVFNPFFTTKPEGTGLGLAIVYRIVNEAGGHISVDSNQDGTCFTISLPLEPLEADPVFDT